MVYAQPSTCPWEWHTQTPTRLWYTNGSPNLCQKSRPYNNQQQKKKKISKIVDFAVLADHRIKLKEFEKRDKYLDLAKELKKTVEHEGGNNTNCEWCFWHGNWRISKGPEGLGSWRPSRDHPNNSIIENDQNIEKSPGDWGYLLSLHFQWKTISLRWCEKL